MEKNIIPKCKLWFSTKNDEGVFGDGKYQLLKAIQKTGSLKAASLSLDISYRKAWGDLKKSEKCLGIKLINKIRGGVDGGKTVLTLEGKKIIKAYSKYAGTIKNQIEKSFKLFVKELLQ